MSYKHKVFYFANNKYIIAIIPDIAEVFLLNSSIDKIPNEIEHAEKIKFDDSKGFIKKAKRVIVITENCNMNCKYCYEGKKNPRIMSWNIILKILYSLFDEAKEKKQNKCSLAIFGGEPSLAYSHLKKLISLINKLKQDYNIDCSLNIVSNGKFSREFADFLIKNFDNIYISFDAPKDIFLSQRSNENDFYQIFNNCKYIYENSDKLKFKITVTSKGINRLSEIMDFYDKDFLFVPQMYQPVMINSNSDLFVDFNKFLNAFAKAKYLRITDKIITTSLFKYFPSSKMCNLHARRIIYPDGKVMACHRINFNALTNEQNIFLLGNIDSSLNENKIKYLQKISVNNIPECEICFAKYHCAGGCTAIKLYEGKKINDVVSYCDSIKKFTLFEISKQLNVPNINLLNLRINGIKSNNLCMSYEWLKSKSIRYHRFMIKRR